MKLRAALPPLLALAVVLPWPAAARTLADVLPSVVSVLPEWPPDARRLDEPEGSGVVILDGRTVVTAAHVVSKALSLMVRTADGEILPAELAGRDPATDLAILSIPRALPSMEVAEKEPELGDRVCAIGNAFGQGLSVTCGVVSAMHRAGLGFNPIEDFIQTDAAVNPGASGGALVNGDGKLVGVLSAIFTKRSDANIGVNFAITAELAMRVAQDLKREGRVRRPISGMRLEPAPAKGETGQLGARVAFVRPGSLAEKAGLKPGDIVVRAGERRIRKPADFVSVMAGFGAGGLELEIVRNGETAKLRLAP